MGGGGGVNGEKHKFACIKWVGGGVNVADYVLTPPPSGCLAILTIFKGFSCNNGEE